MRRVIFTLVPTALFILCGFSSISASADDFSVFALYCPDDVNVDCDTDLSDLSVYGDAYVHGYGAPEPAPPPNVVYNLNSCGVGTVVRTWSVYDYGGYLHTCSQVIHVQGGSFGLSDITWPKDYNTDECAASLDPKDLPGGFDKPEFNTTDCGKPVAGYKDRVFNMGGEGCLKILRDWTVLDWCVYDPNAYYPKGIWTHTQVIMVKIMDAPEMDCPEDITVSTTNNSCDGAEVYLEDATAINKCGDEIKVTHNSSYAHKSGANASGFYPLGTTVVTFFASDACGSQGHCKTNITVKDMKQPTPVCYHGLSASLDKHPDGYYIDLKAEWFDVNSFDNCTPRNKLEFSISPERVDCEDLGEVQVVMTVTDQSGNSDFCVTYINVTDNFGLCPPTTGTITVSGHVFDYQDEPVDHVIMELRDQDDSWLESTPAVGGLFQFNELFEESTVMLKPQSVDNPVNGVTTFDLLLMSQYILGNWEPEDPMDLLAADVDFSGVIDVMDIIYARDVILGRLSNFPNGSAWRFIDRNYTIENRDNPYLDEFPDRVVLANLSEDIRDVGFMAVKLGDLNQSAIPNSNYVPGSNERNSTESFVLDVLSSSENGVYQYKLQSSENIDRIYGLQFAWDIGLDNDLIEIESDYFENSQMDYYIDDSGVLRLSILDQGGFTIPAEQNLITLHFINNPQTLNESDFKNEIYFGLSRATDLDFENNQVANNNGSIAGELMAYPNPFDSEIYLDFSRHFHSNESVELTLMDISGKIVWQKQITPLESGSVINIQTENQVPGIYMLQYRSKERSGAVRLIKQ